MILTADWHLVDTPSEEYRWAAFKHLADFSDDLGDNDLFILGDLADRKDRHTAELANRILSNLDALLDAGKRVTIIMGNHDMPLKGKPYWNILNRRHKHLHFYTKPTFIHIYGSEVLLLPFSSAPGDDWPEITDDMVVFMHQPVDGALLESGARYEHAGALPISPKALVYSGDIHTPQKIGNVRYIGAPHPIKFGDDYKCRMLHLDRDFKVAKILPIYPMRKRLLQVSSIEALRACETNSGDQVKVIFEVDPRRMDLWPAERDAIAEWARDAVVTLVSSEAVVSFEPGEQSKVPGFDTEPKDVLRAFAEQEGLPPKLVARGLQLLQETLDARSGA